MAKIRPAEIYDCQLLATLHMTCFDPFWDAKAFQSLLKEKAVSILIAKVDVKPAGFVAFRTAADEAEILSLGVVPGKRRKGIGKALMVEGLKAIKAKGAQSIFLEVREDREPARVFYETLDFKEVGVRKDYYTLASGKKKDAVTMRCDL